MNTVVRNSTLAIVSLVFGVLSWVGLPIIGSLVAIVTGHMARSEIRGSGGSIGGDGMAIGGLILGWFQLVLVMLALLFVMVFFGGLAALAGLALWFEGTGGG